MENNTVKITGKIMETPEYLLTSPDRRKIYKSTIEVMRTSGNMDVIPIQVPEQIVQEIRDNVGGRITIFGEYRSYNEKDGERNHLKLYVFVKGISEAGEADQNRIDLIGYICKQPLCKYPDCFRCVYPDCTCNEGLTKKGNDELVRELAKR